MDEEWMPRVDEPMEEYLRSDRYGNYSTILTFSDLESLEEANYRFWRSLTPRQRLELHRIMVDSLYQEKLKNNSDNPSNKELIFTDPGI